MVMIITFPVAMSKRRTRQSKPPVAKQALSGDTATQVAGCKHMQHRQGKEKATCLPAKCQLLVWQISQHSQTHTNHNNTVNMTVLITILNLSKTGRGYKTKQSKETNNKQMKVKHNSDKPWKQGHADRLMDRAIVPPCHPTLLIKN